MARNTSDFGFGDLKGKLYDNVVEGIAKATAAADRDLKRGSPVDTGRFRASWFHVQSKGTPDTNAVQPDGKDNYPVEELDASQVDGTKNQLLINNLPYAQRLCEEGWSQKVPADWFQRIKQKWTNGGYFDDNMPKDL